MPNPQHAILTNLTKYQWYTHFSRTDGADLGVIKQALRDTRAAGAQTGVTTPINICVLLGPTLLADLTDDTPEDFQPYPGYEWFPYKEYSEVFYGTDYKVLRGGSWATRPGAMPLMRTGAISDTSDLISPTRPGRRKFDVVSAGIGSRTEDERITQMAPSGDSCKSRSTLCMSC